MAPKLSGQTSIFGVVFFLCKVKVLGIERQNKLKKVSSILTRKPRSDVGIFIYRTCLQLVISGPLMELKEISFKKNLKYSKFSYSVDS